MNDYDPQMPMLRQMLALSIVNKMEECGFELLPKTSQVRWSSLQERVYARNVTKDGSVQVRVYTSVVGGEDGKDLQVRAEGKDAIRVCATYTCKNGKTRGLVKETRINRIGNIDDIVERTYHRMRSAWQSANTCQRCSSCGAPKFQAKSGKMVCAEICWKSDEQKKADDLAYKSKRRFAGKRKYRRWR